MNSLDFTELPATGPGGVAWSQGFGVGRGLLWLVLDSLPLRHRSPSQQTKPPRSLIPQRPPVGNRGMSGEKALDSRGLKSNLWALNGF